MNILFLGPQGSGKGTQARRLAKKLKLFYFESGNFLRELAITNTNVREIINQGKMVPDEEMSSYIQSFFDEKEIYDNIIFDGFPRSVKQYIFFKNWLKEKNVKLNFAFVLEISKQTSIKRLEGRRLDPTTGKIYNLDTDPPGKDVNKSMLIQRDDDKPAAIEKRLEIYHSVTLPLIKELKKDTNVYKIDGEREVNKIQKELERIISEKTDN